jgi:hypothetical protein
VDAVPPGLKVSLVLFGVVLDTAVCGDRHLTVKAVRRSILNFFLHHLDVSEKLFCLMGSIRVKVSIALARLFDKLLVRTSQRGAV